MKWLDINEGSFSFENKEIQLSNIRAYKDGTIEGKTNLSLKVCDKFQAISPSHRLLQHRTPHQITSDKKKLINFWFKSGSSYNLDDIKINKGSLFLNDIPFEAEKLEK